MRLSEQEKECIRAMERMRKIKLYELTPWLSPVEERLLDTVEQGGDEVTVSVIAKELNVPMSAVSRMMRSMEQRNLITRTIHPKDRRNIIVAITPEGRSAHEKFQKTTSAFFMELLQEVGQEDLRQMLDGWNTVMDAMESLLEKHLASAKKEELEKLEDKE